jgi:hypothetical protein
MARLSIRENIPRPRSMQHFLALLLLITLFIGGCGGSDPIVVIQLHPTNPDIRARCVFREVGKEALLQ